MAKKPKAKKAVKALSHKGAKRKNNPTAEHEELVGIQEAMPVPVEHERRNNPDDTPALYERDEDLDPQLVWMGKDEEDREALAVDAVPIYIQEHIHPKAMIEDIRRQASQGKTEDEEDAPDLFADWAGELSPEDKVEFYQHEQSWSNRMILGDSLLVMTSLAEKEGLKGQVQCIFMDPPYGIKFGSNFQKKTTSRTMSDKDLSHEPEAIKAFRDTWSNGINSYLSYLRDRLTVARDLLTPSGSFFMQIGDENVHLVRALMDEVFGRDNFVREVFFTKTGSMPSNFIGRTGDRILWFSRNHELCKFNPVFLPKEPDDFYCYQDDDPWQFTKLTGAQIANKDFVENLPIFQSVSMESDGASSGPTPFKLSGQKFNPASNKHWKIHYPTGMERLVKANRLIIQGTKIRHKLYLNDYPLYKISDVWTDTAGFSGKRIYVVETRPKIIQRCILMTTDPGDLVLDPTCGAGTTAYVAEQWGRRWITNDTSRVSLTLARARLMGAHYDYYLLNDSPEGAKKEFEISGIDNRKEAYGHDTKGGFVLERVPHITLGDIANNTEIDDIWDKCQETLEPLRQELNQATGNSFEEWEIPREADANWSDNIKAIHAKWWEARIARQTEIDASIARNAKMEYLHDKPYKQSGTLRVTGPFTVESLSPYRVVPTTADDAVLMGDIMEEMGQERPASQIQGETRFQDIVFEQLRKNGVQNTKKGERLTFTTLEPWAMSEHIQFEGRYLENETEKKVAICIGPEYGTVTRSLLVHAARDAADYFDLLVVLGFAFEAYADDDNVNIGRIPVMLARMNNDLHMGDKLKAGKSGNLFVVFGEPDIDLRERDDGDYEVEIKGIDIFDPTTGEVTSHETDDIACWFIDTDYNGDAFFVRHAYFSGGHDPYDKLRRALKAEIDPSAWDNIYTTTSRPFPKPETGQIAVKAINDYGDEVLRVFKIAGGV